MPQVQAKTVISIKDPLTLSVQNTKDIVAHKNEDGVITELEIPEIGSITIGRRIKLGTPKQVYKVNSIVVRPGPGILTYDLRVAARTKASWFLLPMFPGTRQAYFYDNLFMNCFVGTPEKSEVVSLLYRFSANRKFVDFEGAIKKLSNFISMEDSECTVLYVFDIPKKHRKDYNLFLEGKYSLISESYKERILDFHKGTHLGYELEAILYKHESRREQVENRIGQNLLDSEEVYSIPNLFSEIYDPEIYNL
jgi:hypothetical protein